VPQLADLQFEIRQAVIAGDETRIAGLLAGGQHPGKRLQIHRRHYETSLITALLGRFPATVWLVGSPFVTEAARNFVRQYPPKKPCIAEYGENFPGFLAARPAAGRAPYLEDFAVLEWHIGNVSIAIDQPAVTIEELSTVPADSVANVVVTVQTGLRYLRASWPVDDLMKLFLTDTAPGTLRFEPGDAWIEVSGARGEFRINRLACGEFIFRTSIVAGRSLGDAAEAALDTDDSFDPGAALARVVSEGLVTAINRCKRE
jgi:hypothetical protein